MSRSNARCRAGREGNGPWLATAAWLGVAAVGSMRSAHAQAVPLAPTADTTIVVSGPLHYSSILVPVGVTVRFVLPPIDPPPFHPAFITCDGDAFVHGTLTLDGNLRYQAPTFTRAAGIVTTGRGLAGSFCGSTPGFPAQGGRHAGTYGSVLPFSLAGGSQGGDISYFDPFCLQWRSTTPGGEGGGTLVLLAGGRIEVDGTITADGASTDSGGSGGSILLRGNRGVTILPGGSVSAQGAPGPFL